MASIKYERLFQSFNKHINLPTDVYLQLESRLESKNLAKKEFLISDGQVINHLPFINNGLMVNYRLDENGNKHVLQIRGTGLWLGDLYSFYSGNPTKFHIQAFRDTELLMINHETFDLMIENYPLYERYFRLGLQDAYIQTLNQVFNHHALTAEERYLKLVSNYPSILDEIPHYLIASFLNIRPQPLSRIRKNLNN